MSTRSQNPDGTRREEYRRVPVTINGFMPMPQLPLVGWTSLPQPLPQNIPQPRPYQPLPMNPYAFNYSSESVLADDTFSDATNSAAANQEPLDSSAANKVSDYPSPTWGDTTFGINYGIQPVAWNLPAMNDASAPAPLPPTPTPAEPVKQTAADQTASDKTSATAPTKRAGKWKCPKCKASYITKASLDRHMEKHNGIRYQCGIAGCMNKPNLRQDSVKRHIKNKHPGQPISIIKLETSTEEDEGDDEE